MEQDESMRVTEEPSVVLRAQIQTKFSAVSNGSEPLAAAAEPCLWRTRVKRAESVLHSTPPKGADEELESTPEPFTFSEQNDSKPLHSFTSSSVRCCEAEPLDC